MNTFLFYLIKIYITGAYTFLKYKGFIIKILNIFSFIIVNYIGSSISMNCSCFKQGLADIELDGMKLFEGFHHNLLLQYVHFRDQLKVFKTADEIAISLVISFFEV